MKGSYNLLGRVYPFFLNNADLSESHYLYQIYSPRLTSDLTPTISFTKISEKTNAETPSGSDLDIVSLLVNKKVASERVAEIFTEFLKFEENVKVEARQNLLPEIISSEESNIAQKTIIIDLRDTLRWKNYRFTPGRFIDILWTPTEFVVYEIKGDNEKMWLEPVNVYKTYDTSLKKPLNVNLDQFRINEKWNKTQGKASELNRFIKSLEWSSFTKRLK